MSGRTVKDEELTIRLRAVSVPHSEKTVEGPVICRYSELELYISYDEEERQPISTVLLEVPKAQ